jgi:universal stress protein A
VADHRAQAVPRVMTAKKIADGRIFAQSYFGCEDRRLKDLNVMKKIKTILCPIDFDVNSLATLDWARELAREGNATLHMLHVVTLSYPLLTSAPFLISRARECAYIQLQEIARESLGNVDHRLVLKTGPPAELIIKTAQELKADVVVMATHGRTGVSRLFLGSVTEKVVRASPCPVLTIRGMSVCQPDRQGAANGSNVSF